MRIYNKPTTLNGWIFAFFGIYDYLKINNNEQAKEVRNRSLSSIESHLSDFDNGYWSKYNIDSMITSPFYHSLHIAQLKIMYEITGKGILGIILKNGQSTICSHLINIEILLLKSCKN